MMYTTRFASLALLLATTCLLVTSAPSQAGPYYANGNNINLASGRSNTYSSSPAQSGFGPNLLAPLYPSYPNIEYRVDNSANGPYWQVNFPRPYSVNNAYLETYDACCGILTMDVRTTTDGINWTTAGSASVVGNSLNTTFPAVTGVVGVRLVSTSWTLDAYPGIIRAVRITGPNTSLPVNDAASIFATGKSEFSITQSTWNGGTIQSAPGWAPYSGGPLEAAIDDYTTAPYSLSGQIFKTTAADPAPIDVLLNGNYFVDTVSIVTGTDTANRDPLSVDISYSSDISGAFIPILTNVSLTGNPFGYYVIPLGGMFDARRIRYDFAASPLGSETFIAELYAFAAFPAVPEPSTLALLSLGIVGVAIKARRRRNAPPA